MRLGEVHSQEVRRVDLDLVWKACVLLERLFGRLELYLNIHDWKSIRKDWKCEWDKNAFQNWDKTLFETRYNVQDTSWHHINHLKHLYCQGTAIANMRLCAWEPPAAPFWFLFLAKHLPSWLPIAENWTVLHDKPSQPRCIEGRWKMSKNVL